MSKPSARPTDKLSVQKALQRLRRLGCPNVRQAEGTDEYASRRGNFRYSPDLMAAQYVGNGARSDFYIDVIAPRADHLFNEKAALDPSKVRDIQERSRQSGKLNIDYAAYGREHFDRNYMEPMRTKLTKYVVSRDSILFGFVVFFGMDCYSIEDLPRRLFLQMGQIDYLNLLADSVSASCGPEATQSMYTTLMKDEPGILLAVVPMQKMFLLLLSEHRTKPKLILLINPIARDPNFEFYDHPVVKWLRRLTQTPTWVLQNRPILFERFE